MGGGGSVQTMFRAMSPNFLWICYLPPSPLLPEISFFKSTSTHTLSFELFLFGVLLPPHFPSFPRASISPGQDIITPIGPLHIPPLPLLLLPICEVATHVGVAYPRFPRVFWEGSIKQHSLPPCHFQAPQHHRIGGSLLSLHPVQMYLLVFPYILAPFSMTVGLLGASDDAATPQETSICYRGRFPCPPLPRTAVIDYI